jgi:hypothetical protein
MSTRQVKIVVIFLCIMIMVNKNHFGKDSSQQDKKSQFKQLSTVQGNELEIITYIERRGEHNSMFGSSVAGIGDINLDGYEDVIIGNLHKGSGEALILFGGVVLLSQIQNNLNSTVEFIIYGSLFMSDEHLPDYLLFGNVSSR